jgi:hypothetical protein
MIPAELKVTNFDKATIEKDDMGSLSKEVNEESQLITDFFDTGAYDDTENENLFLKTKEDESKMEYEKVGGSPEGKAEVLLMGDTEEDLLKETEDEFEISLQNSPGQILDGKLNDSLSENNEFNNTFGKTEERQGIDSLVPDSKEKVKEQQLEEDIIVEEVKNNTEKQKKNINIFEQNIEVLDFKFNEEMSDTTSRDMTVESMSNPENQNNNSLKEIKKVSFDPQSKSHFSYKNGPYTISKLKMKKKISVSNKLKNPQSDRVLNMKKKSQSSNLEISPLKHLLNNLKMSMFKTNDEYQKQLRFERKNRFKSNNYMSSKTLNTKKKKKRSNERKSIHTSSNGQVKK